MKEQWLRYLFDSTAKNPDNLIKHEKHLLSEKEVRVISPHAGAFYVDSLQVKDEVSGKILVASVDYSCAGMLQSLSMKLAKSVATVVLITNKQISKQVTLSYQAVGGDHQLKVQELNALLQSQLNTSTNTQFKDIKGLPKVFKPQFHLHDIGDIYGFDYLVYLIEKIRSALAWSNFDYYYSVADTIDRHLEYLKKSHQDILNHKVKTRFIDFKKHFTVKSMNLSNVKDYPLVKPDDVDQLYTDNQLQIKESAYMHFQALVEYKNTLYENSVLRKRIHLGDFKATVKDSSLATLKQMRVGEVVMLSSQALLQAQEQDYETLVYPKEDELQSPYVVKKIAALSHGKVSDTTGFGGIFNFICLLDQSTYFSKLYIDENNQWQLLHKRILHSDELGIDEDLEKHLNDFTNPHNDHKSKIGLGLVENIPIATKEEIVCNIPARKYITNELAMLYLKRFLTGEKDTADIELSETDKNKTRRMQALFSPCGPCDTKKKEWELVDHCVDAPYIGQKLKLMLQTNKVKVVGSDDKAELIAYLDNFESNRAVLIKVFREVKSIVDTPVDPPAPPPAEPKRYTISWTECYQGIKACSDAYVIMEAGDPKTQAPRAWNLMIGVVKDQNGEIQENVKWEIIREPWSYLDAEAKKVIEGMWEQEQYYLEDTGRIIANPGILNDQNVRTIYGYGDKVTAERTYSFTASIDGFVIGTLIYKHRLKIEYKASGGRYDGGAQHPFN